MDSKQNKQSGGEKFRTFTPQRLPTSPEKEKIMFKQEPYFSQYLLDTHGKAAYEQGMLSKEGKELYEKGLIKPRKNPERKI